MQTTSRASTRGRQVGPSTARRGSSESTSPLSHSSPPSPHHHITAFTCQSTGGRHSPRGLCCHVDAEDSPFFLHACGHVLTAHTLQNSALRLFFVSLRFDSWRWRSYSCRSRTGPSLFRWIVLHFRRPSVFCLRQVPGVECSWAVSGRTLSWQFICLRAVGCESSVPCLMQQA